MQEWALQRGLAHVSEAQARTGRVCMCVWISVRTVAVIYMNLHQGEAYARMDCLSPDDWSFQLRPFIY
jgi:hypothetical protein